MKHTLFTFFILLFVAKVNAHIRLPAIVGDHMVLQRDKPIPLWGWGEPNEMIEVEFREETFRTRAEADGKWFLKLHAFSAGGPYLMKIRSADSQLLLRDILIGDVWLASGQSNMEFGIQTEAHAATAIPEGTDSLIHFFYVPMAASLFPQPDIAEVSAESLNGKWIVCSPEVLSDPKWAWHGITAVGYYFTREIRSAQKVPIGMIASYKGGTPAQAWVSSEGLSKQPAFTKYVTKHDSLVLQKQRGNPGLPKKKDRNTTVDSIGGYGAPANLFNAMIAPLLPYAIKGVIWYQGESNGDRLADALEYETLFPRLIQDWRSKWKENNLPFLYVQLANFRKPAQTPSEGIWPWVREAQLKALSLPYTRMAVITDIGDADNIHPKNKKDVGLRLALSARQLVYGEDLVYTGPVFDHADIEGNKVILYFKKAGGNLMAKSASRTNQLKGFGIAGSDHKFVWADATIEGNKIIVSANGIDKPLAVRYNWADNPPGNLFNKEGLPASPFKTDHWEPEL